MQRLADRQKRLRVAKRLHLAWMLDWHYALMGPLDWHAVPVRVQADALGVSPSTVRRLTRQCADVGEVTITARPGLPNVVSATLSNMLHRPPSQHGAQTIHIERDLARNPVDGLKGVGVQPATNDITQHLASIKDMWAAGASGAEIAAVTGCDGDDVARLVAVLESVQKRPGSPLSRPSASGMTTLGQSLHDLLGTP